MHQARSYSSTEAEVTRTLLGEMARAQTMEHVVLVMEALQNFRRLAQRPTPNLSYQQQQPSTLGLSPAQLQMMQQHTPQQPNERPQYGAPGLTDPRSQYYPPAPERPMPLGPDESYEEVMPWERGPGGFDPDALG
jgi:hypothetical protein